MGILAGVCSVVWRTPGASVEDEMANRMQRTEGNWWKELERQTERKQQRKTMLCFHTCRVSAHALTRGALLSSSPSCVAALGYDVVLLNARNGTFCQPPHWAVRPSPATRLWWALLGPLQFPYVHVAQKKKKQVLLLLVARCFCGPVPLLSVELHKEYIEIREEGYFCLICLMCFLAFWFEFALALQFFCFVLFLLFTTASFSVPSLFASGFGKSSEEKGQNKNQNSCNHTGPSRLCLAEPCSQQRLLGMVTGYLCRYPALRASAACGRQWRARTELTLPEDAVRGQQSSKETQGQTS